MILRPMANSREIKIKPSSKFVQSADIYNLERFCNKNGIKILIKVNDKNYSSRLLNNVAQIKKYYSSLISTLKKKIKALSCLYCYYVKPI